MTARILASEPDGDIGNQGMAYGLTRPKEARCLAACPFDHENSGTIRHSSQLAGIHFVVRLDQQSLSKNCSFPAPEERSRKSPLAAFARGGLIRAPQMPAAPSRLVLRLSCEYALAE